ncbi:hypothetical protein LJK88_05820 [Paenibacillus sp. P26]|nr:hypothetical protein LJK88_05820 [Paenibacillus sp. P26]UUZ90448.1 hypothetical protein LJK87_31685 [Paenibacillus sp. P25]
MSVTSKLALICAAALTVGSAAACSNKQGEKPPQRIKARSKYRWPCARPGISPPPAMTSSR